MVVVILGTGRSGTNVVLETLTGSSKLNSPDDGVARKFCETKKIYDPNTLIKSDIVTHTVQGIEDVLAINPSMKIIWTIRDPRDICMSKIKRGVPLRLGGDCHRFSPDGTLEGSVEYLRRMVVLYDYFKDRDCSMLVRMEDVLLHTEGEARRMCSFLGIPFEKTMVHFYKRMRNNHKKNRYPKKDLSQISLWKSWKTVYDGYFVKNKIDMDKIFVEVDDLINKFGYGDD
jgi:hypothetical protein